MADNTLQTSDLDLANFTSKEIWTKNIKSGVLAQLAASDPTIKTGSTDVFTLTSTPVAELVGEGANKSSQAHAPSKVTVKTYKVQVTYRDTNEVLWADEDYQLGLANALVERIATALSRALDLMAIHGLNPAAGTVAASITSYLTKTSGGAYKVTGTAKPAADVDSMAAQLQSKGYSATGIALDPAFAGELARTKVSSTDSRPLYPELGLGFNVQNFQGLRAASGDTVSARNEASSATNVKAIMGDFNAFKWGIARNVPVELIQYGDPDGNGDLKRTNEVAFRAEAVFGFAFMDMNAFTYVQGSAS